MPSEKEKSLQFKQYMKSDKMPYIISADMESLIKKIDLQIIQKILQQQNWGAHSLWIFNVNNLRI